MSRNGLSDLSAHMPKLTLHTVKLNLVTICTWSNFEHQSAQDSLCILGQTMHNVYTLLLGIISNSCCPEHNDSEYF